MDDTTRKMLVTIGAGIAKKALLGLGATLATHGVINSNQTETFVAVGMALLGVGWSLWNDYGRAIVLSQLEVLKAKSLAQADQARQAGLPPVTSTQIADKSPTLTPTDVAKVVAKLPAASIILLAVMLSVLLIGDAHAQQRRPLDIISDIKAKAADNTSTSSSRTSSALSDIIGALDVKLLPDLQYALKLANASGSKVTAPCYQAWIDIITVRQKAVSDEQGNPLPMPDPALISNFEKMVELRNALQPDSDFMIKCSPVASMVKKDITGFIGLVISGGAGLATLVPGL
jgi:hypothetical protein